MAPCLALTLVTLAACTVTPEDPSKLLEGRRYVVPATRGGLELPPDCAIEPGFIPAARCNVAPDPENLATLRKELLKLRSGAVPDDRLYDWMSAQLATGATDARSVHQAVALFLQGLVLHDGNAAATGSERARLLSELAGAYLLLAEQTQSAVEVLASLEASLEALEHEDLPQARFNRDLALVLLGLLGPEQVTGEPVLLRLAEHLESESAANPESSGCPSDREVGEFLDQWALHPEAHRDRLLEIASCLASAKDRFLPDVLAAGQEAENQTAELWQEYRAAHSAFRRSDRAALIAHIERLRAPTSPLPLRVASGFLEAMVPYSAGDFRAAEASLLRHSEDAIDRGYFGIAAIAVRALSLNAANLADYRLALERAELAAQLAGRAASQSLLAQVRTQQIAYLQFAGRESESWTLITESLRVLDPKRDVVARASALSTAASLAQERGYLRSALLFHSEAIQTLRGSETSPAIVGNLLARSELLLQMGRRAEAAEDLELARLDFDGRGGEQGLAAGLLKADLDLLAGALEPDAETRSGLLAAAVDAARGFGFGHRILSALPSLARARRELGDEAWAEELLVDGLLELRRQVSRAPDQPMAAAMATASRSLIDELIDVQVRQGDSQAVETTLATYLGMRSRSTGPWIDAPSPGESRWAIFALPEELVHLVRTDEGSSIVRTPADRQTLAELRDLLLDQLASGTDLPGIDQTLRELASFLTAPVAGKLADSGETLTIVPDDVLAGLPFGLLPLGTAEGHATMLFDRFAITYSTDFLESQFEAPPAILAVGSSSSLGGYPPLPMADPEARSVAALYPGSELLVGGAATSSRLAAQLANRLPSATALTGLHIASHFEVDTRTPLASALLLEQQTPLEPSRMTISSLLEAMPQHLQLLYLSACRTGTSLPPSPRGIRSLAEAFSASDIGAVVLSLWDLDDDVGSDIAVQFHRELRAGSSPAQALRAAQLRHREEHPGSWASLAVYR